MALLCRKLICTVFGNISENIERIHIDHSKHTFKKTSYKNVTANPKSNLRIRYPYKTIPNALFLKFSPVNYTTCSSSTNQDKDKGGRHQYHEDVEKAINQQILTEFNASYAYLSMSAFFGRSDIALPGCQGFFYDMYLEEIEHGVIFMNYQLMRGGQVTLFPIQAPGKDWGGIENAFQTALKMEKAVKEKITGALEEAEKHHDHQLVDFLTSEYLREQNDSIQKMARFLARAQKMAKNPNGEFLFDRQLFMNYVKEKNLMYCTHVIDSEDKTYH